MNALQLKGSLYPEIELKRMTLSMSSTSTFVDDFMSTWSMEGAVGGATAGSSSSSGTVERQRSPYSVPPEGL